MWPESWTETWKTIPETNEMYEASTHGNVRSKDRMVPHKKSGFLTLKGKQLKPLIGIGGYYYVTICVNGKREKRYNHDLVTLTFYGNRKPGWQVDHIDKNRLNNIIVNLRYTTVLDNCGMSGSAHPRSMLTEDQVLEIRKRFMPRVCTGTMLAKEFGVTSSAIHHIVKRNIWKHI